MPSAGIGLAGVAAIILGIALLYFAFKWCANCASRRSATPLPQNETAPTPASAVPLIIQAPSAPPQEHPTQAFFVTERARQSIRRSKREERFEDTTDEVQSALDKFKKQYDYEDSEDDVLQINQPTKDYRAAAIKYVPRRANK